jgi:hypothetical protein
VRISGRVKKLETTLAARDQVPPDALRVWRRAVGWTEWAHRVHGSRDAALASGDCPPDSIRFTAFTWQLDDFLEPWVPQECRHGNWKKRMRCVLAVVIDALFESGATADELQDADACASTINSCIELMRLLSAEDERDSS